MSQDTDIESATAAMSAVTGHPVRQLQDEPILITVPKAAQLLGISRSAAYRCAASGELPTAHLGGRVYVVTSRLQQLLESA